MSAHASNPATPPQPEGANKAKVIKIVLIILFILFLAYCWNTFQEKHTKNQTENQHEQKNKAEEIHYDYRLKDHERGTALEAQVPPKSSIVVELTHDWCPIWSSDEVLVTDDKEEKRYLKNASFITGKESTSTTYYRFTNETNNYITIKVGRCTSPEDCKIHF